MKVGELACISLTVADLAGAEAFYAGALGFTSIGRPAAADPTLAKLLGTGRLVVLSMQRGRQRIELAQFDPPGAPYPPGIGANDGLFQHCAIVTDDMARAYARLGGFAFTAISRQGPQTLPGGIVAFKLRDPEGHPLELIRFPHADPATAGGIDHSAIAVADVGRSIDFYSGTLGLSVAARQTNHGPAQDSLDDLDAAIVEVVALAPEHAAPHIELLAYRSPRGRPAPLKRPADIAATRLVLTVDAPPAGAVTLADGTQAALISDPDGHDLLLLHK